MKDDQYQAASNNVVQNHFSSHVWLIMMAFFCKGHFFAAIFFMFVGFFAAVFAPPPAVGPPHLCRDPSPLRLQVIQVCRAANPAHAGRYSPGSPEGPHHTLPAPNVQPTSPSRPLSLMFFPRVMAVPHPMHPMHPRHRQWPGLRWVGWRRAVRQPGCCQAAGAAGPLLVHHAAGHRAGGQRPRPAGRPRLRRGGRPAGDRPPHRGRVHALPMARSAMLCWSQYSPLSLLLSPTSFFV